MNCHDLARRRAVGSRRNAKPRGKHVIDRNARREGSLIDDQTVATEIVHSHRHQICRAVGEISEINAKPGCSRTSFARTQGRNDRATLHVDRSRTDHATPFGAALGEAGASAPLTIEENSKRFMISDLPELVSLTTSDSELSDSIC